MPRGNELNAVFPEEKAELHRTCIRFWTSRSAQCKARMMSVSHNRRGSNRALGGLIVGFRASDRPTVSDSVFGFPRVPRRASNRGRVRFAGPSRRYIIPGVQRSLQGLLR